MKNNIVDLICLIQKVDNCQATVDEYNSFEKILIEEGVTQHEINQLFKRANIQSWNEFLRHVQHNSNKITDTEATLIGGLIGYAYYVLFKLNFALPKYTPLASKIACNVENAQQCYQKGLVHDAACLIAGVFDVNLEQATQFCHKHFNK